MSKYQNEYKAKLMSAEQAVQTVLPKKSLIAFGAFAQEPKEVLSELHKAYDYIDEAQLYGVCNNDYPYMSDESYNDKFFTNVYFMGAGGRKNYPNGRISFIPMHLHGAYSRYAEEYTPNVVISCSTPMDKHGYFNFTCGGWESMWVKNAKVIVEIVPDMPRIPGEFQVHISQVDAIVETTRNLGTLAAAPITDTDKKIGELVASLVEDGSTIQLGIGALPDACAKALVNKKDLGVHTEMVTSSMAELANLGVITNERKTLHKNKFIGAFCYGDRALYDYLDENPSVYFMSTNYVNNPFIIAQNYRMVSINTCMEVDLTGQIASEAIGTRMFSGTGGQNDFAEGAIHSDGGKSIIAMHSAATKKDGTRYSKIKSMLTPGAAVTMTRNNIDYIVTENGIAKMKARTIKERVEELVKIAHPEFKEELIADAKKYQIW